MHKHKIDLDMTPKINLQQKDNAQYRKVTFKCAHVDQQLPSPPSG